ncbi:ATP-dependent zinc metalloprotease YME1L1 [Lampetra fluviatilis]
MFSLATLPSQVTVPLSQLLSALHALKSAASSVGSASVQRRHQEATADLERISSGSDDTAALVFRELGLPELTVGHAEELLGRLLPPPQPPSALPSLSAHWKSSHTSSQTFFQNKHGFPANLLRRNSPYMSSYLQPCSVPTVSYTLQLLHGMDQRRGFKTLRLHGVRRNTLQDREERGENSGQNFVKGLLRDKVGEGEDLDKILKRKHIPEGHKDAFKTGFAEGFMAVQTFTQRAQEYQRKSRLYLLALILIGVYLLYKNPFLSAAVRFRTSTGFDASVDPITMKNVTFEHVKGADEAKEELQDVVQFLKNPQKFTVLGGKLPKGILLVGPPGTGKTLMARAVAGEADVPFYYASGSEFDEMFVGVGASRIRNLFREAKTNAPCVIFIDELDSVGGKRIESPMHPYSRQTINQLLAEMDGFKPNEGVIVIGATNFPEALDNALVRPGRFDMQVTVPRPDVKGRTEILKLYLSKVKMESGVDPMTIARGTVGFTGAELENLVNQAALKAAMDGKDVVSMVELEYAKDKILMGTERRSAEIDLKNKTITAYHEGGHALVAFYTKDAMPINKATIMPRGPTLGHVSLLPEDDRWSETKAQLLAQMDVSMGGRVAEEIIFGLDNITTGASSDFETATKIASLMVTRFGMSEKLGVMIYKDQEKLSPETQSAIETEVRAMLQDSYERARSILKAHSREHKLLAEALLKYETLDAREIRSVLEGKCLEERQVALAKPISQAL